MPKKIFFLSFKLFFNYSSAVERAVVQQADDAAFEAGIIQRMFFEFPVQDEIEQDRGKSYKFFSYEELSGGGQPQEGEHIR